MELIINGATYTLKALNYERRTLFNQKVLANYNYQAESFDAFIAETQKILKENHKINLSFEKTKESFFKMHKKAVFSVIWAFLKEEDKTTLKTIDDLEIEPEQIKIFIENICAKIRLFVEESKKIQKNDGETQELTAIYAYVASVFGWTIEHIKEMDELELLKVLEEAILIEKKNRVNKVNSQSLVAAFASGSKQAKSEIDKLNRRLKNEIFNKKMLKENPELKVKDELTREQIANFLGVKNGGK